MEISILAIIKFKNLYWISIFERVNIEIFK